MESLDEVFELFTEERRRFALYYLENANGPVPIEELAEQVYAWEKNGPDEPITDDELHRVILTLEHTHLPKIEDATHIEYDRTNERIQISGLSPEADVLLSVTRAIERPSKAHDFIADRFG